MPVLIQPRLDPKPWGGSRLEAFGFQLPFNAPLGEALITDPAAIVSSGPERDRALGELAASDPKRWVGTRGAEVTGSQTIFPLLIKLIDAIDDLSVQVHPDDALAHELGEPTGKTEAWHILDAEPDSLLYLGLKPDVPVEAFLAAARRGDAALTGMLCQTPAVPGDTWLLPAGSLHAMGRGALVYEIQQPSNTTFRLYDWNRSDAAGVRRSLHHDLGARAVRTEPGPQLIAPNRRAGPGSPVVLVATRCFALERYGLEPETTVSFEPIPAPRVFTVLRGRFELSSPESGVMVTLEAGGSAIGQVGERLTLACTGAGLVLHGWLPVTERSTPRGESG